MVHMLAPLTLTTRCDTGFLIVLPLRTQRGWLLRQAKSSKKQSTAPDMLHDGAAA